MDPSHQTLLAAHRPVLVPTIQEEEKKSPPAAPLDRQSLLVLIKQQLEYFFSEDNLPKDVFLLKQIEKDKTKEGFVSLKVIAGFPNMKKLTHDLGAIREAAEGSEHVILSSDGLSVKRKIPLVLPEDTTEKRTLYVTRLPKDCDRESLMLVFSEFGTVVRLDLPMDKKTGEHKGMAFVEFQAEDELRKALEEFTNSSKYKMIVKPFKSRNSKEIQNPMKDENEEEMNEEKKPNSKRNSKETKELFQENKIKKRNSKENKELSKEIPERRKSGEMKEANKRSSKEGKELKEGNKRSSKEVKRTSKEYNQNNNSNSNNNQNNNQNNSLSNGIITGREVPNVPDSIYESHHLFNHIRARGSSRQRNSDKIQEDPELFLTNQKERPKFHIKSPENEKPLFIPTRNPIGPSSDGLGFGRGRGTKILFT